MAKRKPFFYAPPARDQDDPKPLVPIPEPVLAELVNVYSVVLPLSRAVEAAVRDIASRDVEIGDVTTLERCLGELSNLLALAMERTRKFAGAWLELPRPEYTPETYENELRWLVGETNRRLDAIWTNVTRPRLVTLANYGSGRLRSELTNTLNELKANVTNWVAQTPEAADLFALAAEKADGRHDTPSAIGTIDSPAERMLWPTPQRLLDISRALRDLAIVIRDSVPTTDLFSQRNDDDANFAQVQKSFDRLFELVYQRDPTFDGFVSGPGKGMKLIFRPYCICWEDPVPHHFKRAWNRVSGLAAYFGRCRPAASGKGFVIPSLTCWKLGSDGYHRTDDPVREQPPSARLEFDPSTNRHRRVDEGLDAKWLDALEFHAERLENAVLASHPELALLTNEGGQLRGSQLVSNDQRDDSLLHYRDYLIQWCRGAAQALQMDAQRQPPGADGATDKFAESQLPEFRRLAELAKQPTVVFQIDHLRLSKQWVWSTSRFQGLAWTTC